ncbi:MAG: helix-turn-helix domain-containing protein [Bacillota bacterium]|nr:helix-turn-helix domain-containing protein [Bacillota bacterium]
MDNKKVGSFIASLRKEKAMTQKDLADKLNVTNKAISKWETGEGYPEITTAPVLAEILGVTVTELLNGERSIVINNHIDPAAAAIDETVKYYNKAAVKKGNIAILLMVIVFILTSFICVLCNYLINNTISWSLYPIGALIILLASTVPLLKFKKFKAIGLLCGLTVTLIPYLFLVEYLSPVKGWAMNLALPITILSIIALGLSMIIFNYTKIDRLYCSTAAIVLFGVVVNIGVNKLIEGFLNKPGHNNVSTLSCTLASIFLAVVLAAAAYTRSHKQSS